MLKGLAIRRGLFTRAQVEVGICRGQRKLCEFISMIRKEDGGKVTERGEDVGGDSHDSNVRGMVKKHTKHETAEVM